MPEMRAARANERISNTTGDVWPCRTSGRQFRRSGLIDQDRDLVRNAARSLKPMPFKLIEDPLYKRTGVRRCRIRFHRSRWRHSGRWQAQCHRLHHRQYLVVNQGQQGQHADAAKVQPSRSVLLDIRINSLCEVGRTPGPQPTPGRLGRIVLLDIRVNSLGEVGRTPGPQPTPGRLGRIVLLDIRVNSLGEVGRTPGPQPTPGRLGRIVLLDIRVNSLGEVGRTPGPQPTPGRLGRIVLLDIRVNSLGEVGRTPGPQPTPGRLGRIVLLDIRVNSLGEVGRTPGPQPTPGRLGRIVTRIHNQRLLEHTAVDTTLAKPVPALRRLSSSKIRPPNLLQQNRWDKYRAEDSWAALDWQA